jgi:predicted nuclease of predicted toxin-antitoxin system
LPEDPGDEEILSQSVAANRVLVTLDKDFGELVFVLGQPHRGIIRLVNIRARDHALTILGVLAKHARDLEDAAIVVALSDRIRARRSEERARLWTSSVEKQPVPFRSLLKAPSGRKDTVPNVEVSYGRKRGCAYRNLQNSGQ